MNLKELILFRIKKKEGWDSTSNYFGFDMSKTHSQEEYNRKTTLHNKKVLELFDDYLDNEQIEDFFDCWKGNCFLTIDKSSKVIIKDFPGWTTEDIIEWLIKNPIGKNKEEEIYRKISKEDRYLILKRQEWKCNNCGETLKYNSHSKWKGEVGHIDHIHPYSKKESYVNGEKNINELSNLQALCPKCNLKKGDKKIQ